VEIHVRSVFLQGLLLMPQDSLPSYFDSVKEHLWNLQNEAIAQNMSMLQASLGFVMGLKEIDKVFIGVNSSYELNEVIQSVKSLDKLNVNFEKIAQMSSWTDEKILNPIN